MAQASWPASSDTDVTQVRRLTVILLGNCHPRLISFSHCPRWRIRKELRSLLWIFKERLTGSFLPLMSFWPAETIRDLAAWLSQVCHLM